MNCKSFKTNFSRISLLFPNDIRVTWALNRVVQQAKPNGADVLEERQTGPRQTELHSNKHDHVRILVHQVKADNTLSP